MRSTVAYILLDVIIVNLGLSKIGSLLLNKH